MTIVSSIVVINRPNGSELERRIREIHTDHLGGETVFNYNILLNASGNIVDSSGIVLFNSLADKTAANAVIALNQLADREVQQWVSDMEEGLDPAHVDAGGYFVHSVPEFNVWEDILKLSITPFLQVDYMQDILKCQLTWSRLTKAEGEAIAGKNNEVAGDMAIAENTQVTLESYIPLINEDGGMRP